MSLPKDIVFQILLNLPVGSLLRFKCVCKDWCSMLNTCLFKDTYLALRRARAVDDRVVGLKMKRYDSGIYKSYVTCWYDDYEPLALSASAPSSASNDVEISGNCSGPTGIIGHFNGIVCIKGGNRGDFWEENIKENWFDVTLLNPALREFIKLPVPDLGEDFDYVFSIGFGYDDSTNDYKVFAIVEFAYDYVGLVYHLSTNSWRKLGFMSEFVTHNYFNSLTGEFCLSMSRESIFTHGSIHWIMRSDPNYRILTFNLTTELFQEMLFPHGWRYESYDDETTVVSLFTFDKSTIALVAYAFIGSVEAVERTSVEAQVLDIWVMKEYGDNESWTKQYSISCLPMIERPLSFWKEDKLLIQITDSRLICYDLVTGQVYEYEQCDPIWGNYDLSKGQQTEPPICGPLGWSLELVTGHESFVSLKQV